MPVVDQLLFSQRVSVGVDSEDEAVLEVNAKVCRLFAVEVKDSDPSSLQSSWPSSASIDRRARTKWQGLQDDLLWSLHHPPN